MTVVGGVVQPNYDECSDAPVGGTIIVPGPPGPPGADGADGPPGADGAQGEDGASNFPFVFVFGDGINAPQAGSKIAIPVPVAGTFVAWQARVVGDVTGSAEFHLRHATTPTGALASVGGTQPELVAVKGARSTVVDWGTTAVVQGGVLECEYVDGDVLGVTLLVDYTD